MSDRSQKKHALADRKDDLYETHPVAVHALLREEPLPKCIWEPAAGPGSIVKVLRAAGHTVLATDLVDYGDPTHFSRRDFLMESLPRDIEAITTNPPFKLATEFVQHALDIGCPHTCMLLRLAFLESERRRDIFSHPWFSRVYVFRARLPMMHRAGWTGKKSTSTTPYAWFIWNRSHRGAAQIFHIDLDKNVPA